jgi:lysozyme
MKPDLIALRAHGFDLGKVMTAWVAWFWGINWSELGGFLSCVLTFLFIIDKLGFLVPLKHWTRARWRAMRRCEGGAVSNTRAIGAAMAAVLAGATAATPLVITSEGWENIAYPDPALGAALPTACAGVTENIVLGRRYSDEECKGRTAQALIKTGFAIYPCLPAQLPAATRGAFTSMAYNIGAVKFCGSSVAQAARAGDLKTACVRINQRPDGSPQWIYATVAGVAVPLPGLITRRRNERALCESSLAGANDNTSSAARAA